MAKKDLLQRAAEISAQSTQSKPQGVGVKPENDLLKRAEQISAEQAERAEQMARMQLEQDLSGMVTRGMQRGLHTTMGQAYSAPRALDNIVPATPAEAAVSRSVDNARMEGLYKVEEERLKPLMDYLEAAELPEGYAAPNGQNIPHGEALIDLVGANAGVTDTGPLYTNTNRLRAMYMLDPELAKGLDEKYEYDALIREKKRLEGLWQKERNDYRKASYKHKIVEIDEKLSAYDSEKMQALGPSFIPWSKEYPVPSEPVMTPAEDGLYHIPYTDENGEQQERTYTREDMVNVLSGYIPSAQHQRLLKRNQYYRDDYARALGYKNWDDAYEKPMRKLSAELDAILEDISGETYDKMVDAAAFETAPSTEGTSFGIYVWDAIRGGLTVQKEVERAKSLSSNDFISGFDEGFDWVNVFTLGLAELGADINLNRILNKVNNGESLDERERKVYRAYEIGREMESLHKEFYRPGPSFWNKVGSGVGTSTEFLTQFALGMGLTGGIGSGVNLGGQTLSQFFKNSSKRAIGSYIGKKAGIYAARSAVAAPATPMMWSNYVQRRNQQYSLDADGNLVKEEKPWAKDLGIAYVETFNEYFSEYLGYGASRLIDVSPTVIGRVVGFDKWAGKLGLDNAMTYVRAFTPSPKTRAIWRNMGFSGTITEAPSEILGDFMSSLMLAPFSEEHGFKQFADPQYWKEMYLTTAIFGGAMSLPSLPGQVKAAYDTNKNIKARDAAMGRIQDEELRNSLKSVMSLDSTEEMSQAMADLHIGDLSPDQAAAALEYVSNATLVKVATGEMMEDQRMAQMAGLTNILPKLTYKGKDGSLTTDELIEVTDKKGRKLYVVAGDVNNISDTNMLKCATFDSEGNVVTESLLASEVVGINRSTMDAKWVGAYERIFGAELAVGRLQEIEGARRSMENPSGEVVRAHYLRNGLKVYNTGEEVTLVDGRTATVETLLDNGHYLVRSMNPETQQEEMFDIPFMQVLQPEGTMAEAQKKMYADSLNKVAEDIVEEEITEQAEGMQEETEEQIDAIEEQIEEMPQQVPTREDGKVDYNAIDDPKVYAAQFAKDMGDEATAKKRVGVMAQQARAQAEKLRAKSETLTDANEIIDTNAKADALEAKADFYDKVAAEYTAKEKKSKEEVFKSGDTVEYEGRIAEVVAPEGNDVMIRDDRGNYMVVPPTALTRVAGESTTEVEAEPEMQEDEALIAKTESGLVQNVFGKLLDKRTARIIDAMAKALGLKVVFVERVRTQAGTFANADIQGNVVRMSWSQRGKAISFLAGHEFLHRIKDMSEEVYNEFKQSVIEHLGEEEWKRRVDAMRANYEAHNAIAQRTGKPLLTYDDALLEEEVVADFAGYLAHTHHAFETYVQRQEQQKTQKFNLLRWLRDVFAYLRDWYKRFGARTEAQRMKEMVDKLNETIDRAIADAKENGVNLSNEQKYSISATEMAEIEAERRSIIETAKANGTYLKAPNGKDTNLTPEQWVDVRTKRFKEWFGDWELAEIAEYLMSDDVVAILSGKEFAKDGTPLTKKVSEFYEDNYNGKVTRKGLGEVILDKRSVKDSTIHGFGKAKTAAFAAVPNIITEGRIIDEQKNWKGRNYDSVTIAAPIRIGGSNYVGIVIVRKGQGTNSNRFYLHEVVLQENLQDESFKTDTKADSHRGDIAKVMQKIFISKENSSKIVDENGEPKEVFHGTPNDFYVFGEDVSSKRPWTYEDTFYFTDSEKNAKTYGGRVVGAFLNIRNPYVYDFEGRSWRNLKFEIAVAYGRDNSILASGFATKEEAQAWLENFKKENPEHYAVKDENGRYLIVNENTITGQAGLTTDEQTQTAKAEGYDGNIQKNISDTAGGEWVVGEDGVAREEVDPEVLKPRTNYVVYDSRQIKSSTENVGTYDANNPDIRYSLSEVNDRFNEELATLTEENARERILNVGTPSPILLACGIEDKPIRLYGAKLLSKVRKHGYKIDDLKNLPLAISSPIAVFEGSKKNSFAILTELRIGNSNVLAALSVGKGGHDVDFNIISSVYDKREDSVARWVNDGKMLWVDKKKALDYFSVSAPIAEAQNNQELISTTKVIQNFENPKIEPKNSLRELDAPYLDAVERGDMETAQRMVLEAAKLAMPNTKVVDEDGNPKVVYHGTGSEFYTFRKTNDINELGAGYYFSDSYEMAERYATDETLADNRFRVEALAFDIFTDEMGHSEEDYDDIEFEDDYNESYALAVKRLFGNGRVMSVFLNIEKPRILSRVSPDFDPVYQYGFNYHKEGVLAKRYNDGVIDEMFTERHNNLTGNQYVAFNPNQIKSADSVTYDDNGNVIPLSERFNPKKEDIRYSLSEEDARFERKTAFLTDLMREYNIPLPTFIAQTSEEFLSMVKDYFKLTDDEVKKYEDRIKAMDGTYVPEDEIILMNGGVIRYKEQMSGCVRHEFGHHLTKKHLLEDISQVAKALGDDALKRAQQEFLGGYSYEELGAEGVVNELVSYLSETPKIQEILSIFEGNLGVDEFIGRLQTRIEARNDLKEKDVYIALLPLAKKNIELQKQQYGAEKENIIIIPRADSSGRGDSISQGGPSSSYTDGNSKAQPRSAEADRRGESADAQEVDYRHSLEEIINTPSDEEHKTQMLELAQQMERDAESRGLDLAQEIADTTGWVHLDDGTWKYYGDVDITEDAAERTAVRRWLESKAAVKKSRTRKMYYQLIREQNQLIRDFLKSQYDAMTEKEKKLVETIFDYKSKNKTSQQAKREKALDKLSKGYTAISEAMEAISKLENERDEALAQIDADLREELADAEANPAKYERVYEEESSWNAQFDIYTGALQKARNELSRAQRDMERAKLTQREKAAAMNAVRSAITEMLRGDLGRYTRKRDIQALMNAVNEARTMYAMMRAVDKALMTINDLRLRKEKSRMNNLLKLRIVLNETNLDPLIFMENIMKSGKSTVSAVRRLMDNYWRGVNASGVDVAKGVDGDTGIVMQFIRDHVNYDKLFGTTGVSAEAIAEYCDRLRKELRGEETGQESLLNTKQINTFSEELRERMEEAVSLIEGYLNVQSELKGMDIYSGVSNAQQEIESIQAEIKKLNEEIKELTDQKVAVTDGRIVDAKKEIEARKKEIQRLNREIASARINNAGVYIGEMPKLIERMYQLNSSLESILKGGRADLSAFNAKKEKRRKELVNMTLEAIDASEEAMSKDYPEYSAWQKIRANGVVHFFTQHLGSMDHMLRRADRNAPNGEGILYNFFMPRLIKAKNAMYTGIMEIADRMSAKTKALFGKEYNSLMRKAEGIILGEISVTHADGKKETYEYTLSNALYTLAIWDQPNGRESLRRQGFTDEHINQLREWLKANDPKWLEFEEWVVNDLLPSMRTKYNKVYREINGVDMDFVDAYFPIRRLDSSIPQSVDIAAPDFENKPSVMTGAIIKRTNNKLPIDVRTSFFGALQDHVKEMEEWAAMAPIIQDFNMILSNPKVRKAMDSVDERFFKDFSDAAKVATLNYTGDKRKLDNLFWQMALRTWASRLLGFKAFTALKQLTSSVLFMPYSANPKYMGRLIWYYLGFGGKGTLTDAMFEKIGLGNLVVKSEGEPWFNIKWAMENSAMFRRRWESGVAGNDIFQRELKYNERTRWGRLVRRAGEIIDDVQRLAMSPIALVDAYTVAAGMRAIYDFEMTNLLKQGYSEAEARKIAMLRAEVAANKTQQSSESEYLAPIQKNGGFISAFTIFQNAPFAQGRMIAEAWNELTRDYKKEIEFIYKQELARIKRENAAEIEAVEATIAKEKEAGVITNTKEENIRRAQLMKPLNERMEREAQANAEKRENKAKLKAVRTLIYNAFIGQAIFNLAGQLPYLLFGDDDEKKRKIREELNWLTLFAPMGTIVVGSAIMSLLGGHKVEFSGALTELQDGINDIVETAQKEGVFDVMLVAGDFLVKKGLGLDLDSFYKVYSGIENMFEDGMSAEAMLLALNGPESQVRLLAGDRKEGETVEEYVTRNMRLYTIFSDPEYSDYYNAKVSFIGDEPAGRMTKKQMREMREQYDQAYRSDVMRNKGRKDEWKKFVELEEEYAEAMEHLFKRSKPSRNSGYVDGKYHAPIDGLSEEDYQTLKYLALYATETMKYAENYIGQDEDTYLELVRAEAEAKREFMEEYNKIIDK